MMVAADVSAAKPCTGCSRTILWPRVRMMRQPPTAVPAAMVTAQVTLIQVSMSPWVSAASLGCSQASQPGSPSSVPACWAETRARAMIPIVFWASFSPWASPM